MEKSNVAQNMVISIKLVWWKNFMGKQYWGLDITKMQFHIASVPVKQRVDIALLIFSSVLIMIQDFSLLLIVFMISSLAYHIAHYHYERSSQILLEQYSVSSSVSLGAISRLAYPVWWIPVLNWNYIRIMTAILVIHYLYRITEFSVDEIAHGAPIILDLFQGLLRPDLTHLYDAVYIYARQTIEVALLGTFIGFFIAIPLSMLCADNLIKKGILGAAVYYTVRMLVTVIRALPTFLLGLIFVAMVGLGPFPGVLAISIFSAGIMVKLFSETFESLPTEMAGVVKRCGGNWVNVIYYHYIPKAAPLIVAQTLYCMEINIHSATVLGLIGAEGIGLPIHEYLSAMAFSIASAYILVTVIMTVLTDYLSVYLRSKIS
ncbi:ABC transporter permease subunit [Dasania sp. GY-MA-18]|uniref:ABC transporter permease subunit n=1 Tax=Dasania phycosphaerae TaxID=2950436 RepID=A0A9J6RNM9_9GAMM|nr:MULTISPECIES: ABC transporter permease subunit [Dasania]MCR8923488.1 ABC transporter permease subunit [Dasania sp. GY-MA-18]MCZ0865921.1 ABC transporter permease subunit [Dasania phycosphaerae]MCZ0869646.1 ABC transporter permease subunit [Dasania phycosphaerae]